MKRKISDQELFFAWRTLFYPENMSEAVIGEDGKEEQKKHIFSIREAAKKLSEMRRITISEDRLREVIKKYGTKLRQEAIEEHAPENYEDTYDWATRFAKRLSIDYRIDYRYVRKHIDRAVRWAKETEPKSKRKTICLLLFFAFSVLSAW